MLYYLLCAVHSSLMAVIIDTNALTRETNALWLELDEELRLHKIAGGDRRNRTADLLNAIYTGAVGFLECQILLSYDNM